MKFLLDTNALLFWLAGIRIKKRVRDLLVDPANSVYVSAVSVFEIAVKASLGRLQLPSDPKNLLPSFFDASGLSTLPVSIDHAFAVYSLPHHHADPFDRLLIAQALEEHLTIVTSDRTFLQYKVELVLVG